MGKDGQIRGKSPSRRQPAKAAARASSAARAIPKTKEDSFPIVAIGMSAGGLEAATQFLNAMPPDSGAGFVIVQHLEPRRKSLLAELLAKQTSMTVVDIENGMRIKPNRVHVIIPAKTLLIRTASSSWSSRTSRAPSATRSIISSPRSPRSAAPRRSRSS